ncbi:hypothetical protein D3C81_1297350 [compost metagenome]
MPLLVRVVLGCGRRAGGCQATQEFLGELGLHARVVVASAWHEGPVVPADFILHEQAVGVDRRVREVADQSLGVCRATGTRRGAAHANRQAGAGAAARAGDLLVLEGGAVGQQVIGGADVEGLVQLGVEHPLAVLVSGVAGA